MGGKSLRYGFVLASLEPFLVEKLIFILLHFLAVCNHTVHRVGLC